MVAGQPAFADVTPVATVVNQQKQVTGTVIDSFGEPIIGANVVVKGTTIGVITDLDGKFAIHVPSDNSVLDISYIGYKTQEVPVSGKNVLTITMEMSAEALDEVVVVGYGTQKKANLTGSVQNVTSADLTRRSLGNTSTALQGLVPGVTVVQSSGQPGADGSKITIRGTGSLNSSTDPLVLIDGVEGDLNYIDLNAIESISVLKDAASASIYGSRASNGVILITTKRSKEEGIRVSYNGYVGINKPTEMPEAVNAVQYMEAVNVARANANIDPQYSQELINQYKTEGADNFYRYDTDWRKEIIKDLALVHNHSVSLSGGSNKISYFANAGYYYQDGQISNNDYSRMTLRMNTDAQITSWAKLGLDVSIRQSKEQRPSQEGPKGIISKAITFAPVFSGINSDGTWGFGQNGDNPIAISKDGGIYNEKKPELGIKGFLQINPFEGFDALVSYSSRREEIRADSYVKAYDTYESGVFKTTFPTTGSSKAESNREKIYNQFNLQASYEKTIARNYFKVLAGMQTEELNDRWFSAGRSGYDFAGFEQLNHGDVSTATNSGSYQEWALLSYFGRINYAFNDRYLLEFNGRWDASSRFMDGHRWGFFPSASAGWRISEESFFENIKNTVDNLKIRASYGTLGNQDIRTNDASKTPIYFPYAASVATGAGYWFDKTLGTGVAQWQVANELISWEKSTQLNIGLDAGLFNSRLALTFDYYIRNITQMLQQFPIPMYVGLSSAWENAGSMRNRGWDLSINWRDRIGNVDYYVTGNLSDVKNKVTDLFGNEYIGTQATFEGHPLRSWYGYVSDGYFQSQEEIDAYPVYGGNKDNYQPGYIKYLDISGPDGEPDGVIDDHDRTIIGNDFPRYEFSLHLGANWKQFDISASFQGVGKKDVLLWGYGARPFYVGRTILKNQLDYWTPENRNAEFPILLIDGSGTNPNNIVSDFWIKNGAYMRLKNLVIGYTLPKSLLKKMKIEHLRLFANGQNLFTIHNAYKGFDPENEVNSGSFYPVMQTFTFGIDIRF